MKTLCTLLLTALFGTTLYAQGVITRINNGQSYFNYTGDLAAVAAEADLAFGVDTIILGGGTYALPENIIFNTPMVIIGSGFRSDSSATYNGGRTVLTTTPGSTRTLYFHDGADGSQMHGLTVRGSIRVSLGSDVGNSAIDGFRVVRCEIESLHLGPINWTGSNVTNPLVEESVIDYLDIHQSTNAVVRSCFIKVLVGAVASSNSTVENSIFLNWSIGGNVNVNYLNCIFAHNFNAAITVNEASTFRECVFAGNGTGFGYTFGPNATDGLGNQLAPYFAGQAPGAVLPNIPAAEVTASFTTYSPNYNYNVGPTWVTAGQNGTQVGVYGGETVWKDGSLPFNPHWRTLSTNGATSSGTLGGVLIQGSAQTH